MNEFWNSVNDAGSIAVDSIDLGDFIGKYNEAASPGTCMGTQLFSFKNDPLITRNHKLIDLVFFVNN